MPKRFIVFIFSLLSMTGLAQKYYPFVKEGGTWIYVAGSGGIDYPFYSWSDKYVMHGDTLINQQLYKLVYYMSFDSIPVFDKKNINAGVREDSTKKVFVVPLHPQNNKYSFDCLSSDSIREYLLFDFNLQSGDTITFHYPDGINFSHSSASVDSMEVNGSYRKRITLNGYSSYGGMGFDIWIEGIGSHLAFTAPYCEFFEWGSQLGCYYDSATYYRPYDTTRSCATLSIKKEKTESKLDVYPNPTDGTLIIKMNVLLNDIELTVYNSLGQVVLQKQFENSSHLNQILLPENSSNGIYFIEVSGHQWSYQQKFILQR